MKIKLALIGLVALGGAAVSTGAASAMPIGLASNPGIVSNVEQARLVCGPRGCCRRPNYYGAYDHYGRGYHGRRWGWHRHWHRGWRRW